MAFLNWTYFEVVTSEENLDHYSEGNTIQDFLAFCRHEKSGEYFLVFVKYSDVIPGIYVHEQCLKTHRGVVLPCLVTI